MDEQRLNPEDIEQLTLSTATEQPTHRTPGSSLLDLLAPMDRQQLGHLMTEQVLEPGQILFREGEPGDAACLIRSGRVAILKGSLKAPTLLGYRGPGEIIGEMALLEGQTRSATAAAVSVLRLLRIERAGFEQLLERAPALGVRIMATLSSRLRAADDARTLEAVTGQHLADQVTRLESDRERLIETVQVRQETADLVVHDLRNPLGIVMAALQMLEMVLPEPELAENQELIQVASAACGRMQRLVDTLLSASRLEAGQINLKIAPVDLSSIMNQVILREQLTLTHVGISARTEIPPDLGLVSLDLDLIDRVLANLFDNAIKYTSRGGVITLGAKPRPDSVVISVTDTGPGIPTEQRQRIFGRFAQAEDDVQIRGSRGFGLGLAYCRLAVNAHGGEIWVEAGSGGRGSRFAFTLPRTVNPAQPGHESPA